MSPRVSLIAAWTLAGFFLAEPMELSAADSVSGLIADLGADSYRQREAASQQLLKVGESALPELRLSAHTSSDPEIRYRANLLVDRVMQDACRSGTTGMKLALIDGGEFMMGSPGGEPNRREDERQHRVRILAPFLLGACEVTQNEYRQVMQTQPSWFSADGEGKDKVAKTPTGKFPVDSVSWFDAIEFCNRLSKLDGRPAYYQLQSIKRQADTITDAEVTVLGGLGYRLPTEAEWEFACRAGGAEPFHTVDGKKGLRGNFQFRQAVLYGSRVKTASLGRSTKVGSYAANAWGLHDMHGNVAEWVWDWYDKGYYAASPVNDPHGPKTGNHRVLRGGSWLVQQSSCRCATRFWQVPAEVKYYVGFRVARDASVHLLSEE